MKFQNKEAQELYDKHIANKNWIRTVAVATLAVAFVVWIVQAL